MAMIVYIEKKGALQTSSNYKVVASYFFDIGWVNANYRISKSGTGPKVGKLDDATHTYRVRTACMYYVYNPYGLVGHWATAGYGYSGGI